MSFEDPQLREQFRRASTHIAVDDRLNEFVDGATNFIAPPKQQQRWKLWATISAPIALICFFGFQLITDNEPVSVSSDPSTTATAATTSQEDLSGLPLIPYFPHPAGEPVETRLAALAGSLTILNDCLVITSGNNIYLPYFREGLVKWSTAETMTIDDEITIRLGDQVVLTGAASALLRVPLAAQDVPDGYETCGAAQGFRAAYVRPAP